MTEPADSKRRSKTAPAAAVVALLASLAVFEGREYRPYYDQAGVLTACKGITGPDVVKGRWYTPAECDALETRYVDRMNARMGHCIGNGLNLKEWVAWGHFTYNVGTPTFCNSTAAKLLREGKPFQACQQMKKWVYITKPGIGKVNCRLKEHKCGGIPKRRDYEYQMCIEAQA